MKPHMRKALAREPFKEKLRMIAQLIALSRKVKRTNSTAKGARKPVRRISVRAAGS